MDDFDEAEKLRFDDDDWNDHDSQRPQTGDGGAPTFVGQTTTITTYPTTARAYYAVKPQGVLGTQIEGTAASFTPYGTNILAANLGSAIPPVTTYVLCTFIDNRWVFRYD